MTVMVSEGLMTLLIWTFPLKIHKQKQETCYLVIWKKKKKKKTLYCQLSESVPVKQTTYLQFDDRLACVPTHLRAYLLFYLQNEKGGRGGELDSSDPAVPSQCGCRQLGAHYS